MTPEAIIRLLTICSLAGLLFGVGLRLTWAEVSTAVRRCRLALIIAVNFIAVPVLVVLAIRLFGLPADLSFGMLILAAAPFAPVVPVFARMAFADLALAAGLTSLFPLLSAFLTPLVITVALLAMPESASIQFGTAGALLTLLATITLPLALGVGVNQFSPTWSRLILRPIEVISEGTGALSLAFVTIHEGPDILATGWYPLLVMALLFEISLALGWWIGGPDRAARQVIALGTSNRNIALAILIALSSFSGTKVISAVVANGLLLIFLGLLHVAFWRFGPGRRSLSV